MYTYTTGTLRNVYDDPKRCFKNGSQTKNHSLEIEISQQSQTSANASKNCLSKQFAILLSNTNIIKDKKRTY